MQPQPTTSQNLVVVNVDDLERRIERVVTDVIMRCLQAQTLGENSSSHDDGPTYISTIEAAALVNRQPQTLYDRRMKNLVPDGVCIKGPKRLNWHRERLLQAVADGLI